MLYRMYPQQFQEDLQGPYQQASQLLDSPGPITTLAGDCHLGNFGTVMHEDEKLVWSLNDFDQTGKGRVESDLCRAGASLALMAQERGWDEDKCRDLIDGFVRHYAAALDKNPPKTQGLQSDEVGEPLDRLMKKASKKTQEELLSKWAEPGGNGFQLKFSDSLKRLNTSEKARLEELLSEAKLPGNVTILDQGKRLDAGGSSLGLERFYLLAQSPKQSLPVLLELKQILPSALLGSDPDPKNADPKNLESGFRRLGAPRDPWHKVVSHPEGVYMLRERQRVKDSVKLEDLSFSEAEQLAKYAGRVLAQAHSIAGASEKISDWMDGEKKQLSRNLNDFSQRYAAQVVQDFQALTP